MTKGLYSPSQGSIIHAGPADTGQANASGTRGRFRARTGLSAKGSDDLINPNNIRSEEVTRRGLLQGFAGAAAVSFVPAFPIPALAQGARFKIGFMLPYTGTLAKLGQS